MQLEGQETFQATVPKLWKILTDPEVLAQIMPGGAELKAIGPDSYQIFSLLKVGLIKIKLDGELHIIEKEKPNRFTLDIHQKSNMGEVDVVIHIKLKKIDKLSSEVAYDGTIKLSGMMGKVSDKVVQPVANLIVKGFMRAMKERTN